MSKVIAPRLTVRSSELSRNPASVFASAEEHDIVVTRRDGESLVLMTQQSAEARERLLQLAAQIIAATTDDRGTLGDRMADRFPWMLALGAASREQCAADLVRASRASFELGQAHLAIAELTSWRETASAIAAGLSRDDLEWQAVNAPVDRP